MPYPYQIWDVFTDTPLAGNPLAVVFDADGLTTPQSQAIASEFNLSETIFLSAPEDRAHTHTARIFTPQHELPFAGHPTVGGALAAARRAGGLEEVVLALKAGPARCRIADGAVPAATVTAPQRPALEDGVADVAQIARALGLPQDLIGAPPLTVTRATSGPRWTIVPLPAASHLTDIRLDIAAFDALGAQHTSCYAIAPDGPDRYRCRMFAPASGIVEDPATGSAAVAFAALWVEALGPVDGEHALSIVQGVEMGRPSELSLTIAVDGGDISRVDLTGTAVLVAEGTLFPGP